MEGGEVDDVGGAVFGHVRRDIVQHHFHRVVGGVVVVGSIQPQHCGDVVGGWQSVVVVGIVVPGGGQVVFHPLEGVVVVVVVARRHRFVIGMHRRQ